MKYKLVTQKIYVMHENLNFVELDIMLMVSVATVVRLSSICLTYVTGS